jgi:hypothetical protein
LALPLVALVAVSAVEVKRAGDRADEVEAETELATATVGPGSLISSLQNERSFTGLDQLGLAGAIDLPVTSLEEARAATDAAVVGLTQFVGERGEAVAEQFAAGLAAVESDLATLRADIDASTIEHGITNVDFPNELFERYTAIINVLLNDSAGFALDIDDANLRNGSELVGLSMQVYELGSRAVRDVLMAGLTANQEMPLRLSVARLRAARDQLVEQIMARSHGPYEGLPEARVLDPRIDEQNAILDQYPEQGISDIPALTLTIQSSETSGFLALRNAQRRRRRGATGGRSHRRRRDERADHRDGPGRRRPGGRRHHHDHRQPLDHQPAAVAHPPGPRHGHRHPAVRRPEGARHPAG